MTDLTVVLPVHNEAQTIEETVRKTRDVLRKNAISHEILCVENGSTDESLKILKKLSRQYLEIRILRSRVGWGNAVRKGLADARGRLFCYMVSDGQVDPACIPVLLRRYREKRVALVKVWRKSREDRIRFIVSRCYNLLTAAWFGLPSRDINATPKIAETKLLRSLPTTADNFLFDIELLLALKKRNLPWLEIPVPSNKRAGGRSTTNLKNIWDVLRFMVRTRF